ncbi:MAG: hypothetical protein WC516_07065 [Patescibacteria group bacterium]|jgi:hypothetical protein
MRTINTDGHNIEKIIEEAKKLIREYCNSGYIGGFDQDTEKRVKKFIKKMWGLDEADEPEDVPKIGRF